MPIHDHTPSLRGRAFVWAGVGLGALLVAVLYTHGFGLLRSPPPAEAPAMFVRQGERIVVPEGSPLRSRLTVLPAPAEPVRALLLLPGVVEADPARTAAVLTPLAGRIVELKVALGDRVARGQVLALIDSPDLAQAYDDDAKAADTLALTTKNLTRQEGQLKLGTASDRDLDQARSDHAQAAAEYARTQAHLKTLGIAAAAPRARWLEVRAPVGGSVTELAVAPGNMINDPTQPLMTIADLSSVWVTALVPEKDLGEVQPQQDAEVSLTAYPERRLRGKVQFVADVLDPDSRRGKVRIAFANADYALKPNMFATVTLQGPQQTRVVLPASALLMNNDRTSVFVGVAPWTFERRTVEPQIDEGASVAIRAGVAAGDPVVVKGGILLND